MRLIGQVCKHGDMLSWLILIGRGLNQLLHFKLDKYYSILKEKFGDYSIVDTPVSIPNTEVKHYRADDSWVRPAKVSRCQAPFLLLPQ